MGLVSKPQKENIQRNKKTLTVYRKLYIVSYINYYICENTTRTPDYTSLQITGTQEKECGNLSESFSL